MRSRSYRVLILVGTALVGIAAFLLRSQIAEGLQRVALSFGPSRVTFHDERLGPAVERFAIVAGRRVFVAPEVRDALISGDFKRERFDSFLDMLPKIMAVEVIKAPDGTVQIVPAKPALPP